MTKLEFWYDFASTYSYLSATQISDAVQNAGVEVSWHPFLLGPIFQAQGYKSSPFNANPVKGKYMLQDIRRLALTLNIPFSWPQKTDGSDGFPRHPVLAARTALVGLSQGWGEAFSRRVFEVQFGEGMDISNPETIAGLIAEQGREPADTMQRATLESTKKQLRENTDRAMEIGLFGAPSFLVGPELFWGHDRMHAAISFARTGTHTTS